MRDGFVRVASGTPRITLADTTANAKVIIELMCEASGAGAKLLVLPELCLTGYTCGDLFFQRALIQGALFGLEQIIQASTGQDMLTIVGLPMPRNGRLFNCAAVVKDGELLAVVPKSRHSARGVCEQRWFSEGPECPEEIDCFGVSVPFGEFAFAAENMPGFTVSVAFSNWIFGQRHCDIGASIIACPMAAAELVSSARELELFACVESKRMTGAVVLSGAGLGESTTDMVFAGRRLIAENGKLLCASAPYQTGLTMAEIDASFLQSERMRLGDCVEFEPETLHFSVKLEPLTLSRHFDTLPFVPSDPALRQERCERILSIQAQALMQRMRHIHCERAVLGVSGGLDSTLAMLVAARAIQALELPKESLLAVTMPCFGTTERTKSNALKLTECLGGQLREIDITASVTQHFMDIGHDINMHDTTYENAQARERTQVLMDIANQANGLVIGTGDLSELALGWATYNGDHMSMYSVNAGVPKTLVRHLVAYCADLAGESELKGVLLDILNTPVSPELLPPVNGVISQRTEELVGPYELHDFFIYHMLRRMERPQKIKRLAVRAFEGVYDEQTIDKWLRTFLRRFFSQQFKRSCLPDGPGVGSVSLSPRGAFVMPSDAASQIWLEDLPSS